MLALACIPNRGVTTIVQIEASIGQLRRVLEAEKEKRAKLLDEEAKLALVKTQSDEEEKRDGLAEEAKKSGSAAVPDEQHHDAKENAHCWSFLCRWFSVC